MKKVGKVVDGTVVIKKTSVLNFIKKTNFKGDFASYQFITLELYDDEVFIYFFNVASEKHHIIPPGVKIWSNNEYSYRGRKKEILNEFSYYLEEMIDNSYFLLEEKPSAIEVVEKFADFTTQQKMKKNERKSSKN